MCKGALTCSEFKKLSQHVSLILQMFADMSTDVIQNSTEMFHPWIAGIDSFNFTEKP